MLKNRAVGKNKKIFFLSDNFLQLYKTEFESKYLSLYKNGDREGIKKEFDFDSDRLIDSGIEFNYKPLVLSNEKKDLVFNAITLYESLRFLTPVQAENEKLWVCLANTHYLDFNIFSMEKKSDDRSIVSRSYFSNGKKRSLYINNLSLLWWIVNNTIDDFLEDKYYWTKFLLEIANRGDIVVLFSSNLTTNKETTLGILSGIKYLMEENIISGINRKTFSESNKILNIMGGVCLIDMLSRDEIKEIIIEQLPKQHGIKL